MESKPLFVVTGDPIIDTYHLGTQRPDGRFVVQETRKFAGGALNIWKNLKAITGQEVYFTDFRNLRANYPVYWDGYGGEIHEITRYHDGTQVLFETAPEFHYQPSGTYKCNSVPEIINGLAWTHREPKRVLVIGDYNKGTVNVGGALNTGEVTGEFDLCVVDSRHRSLDLNLIKTSKVKVWHCTGSEWDDAWADNFDYVVHSNGPSPILVDDVRGQMTEIIPVPDTPVVDPIGAGDTLTAALAAHLAYHGTSFTLQEVADATAFAVECCQEVIQIPFTAVTTRKL